MQKLLLVNKEKDFTSFDVCHKVSKLLNNIKVGHTGTLDPNATGLMVLVIDKASKLLPYIVSSKKEYIATVKMGYKTDTLDVVGETIETKQISKHNENELRNVLNGFLGEQLQIPPMYSAKKVNGQKLYDLARKGKEIERKPERICINEIELISFDNIDTFIFRVNCSKGTYIRVLVQDIANKLNELATLVELKRTKIDQFRLEDAYSLKDIENNNYQFIDPIYALNNYQIITANNIQDIYNGKTIKLDNCDEVVFIKDKEQLVAVYKKEDDNKYHCLRGLW